MSRRRNKKPQVKMQKNQKASLIKGLSSKATSGSDGQSKKEAYKSAGKALFPLSKVHLKDFVNSVLNLGQ